MRILVLPRYNALGASSRLRMLQYLPALRDEGIEVDVRPLLDDGYVTDLYESRISIIKVVCAYVRRLLIVLAAGKYDVVWIEKELWPWLPALVERLLSLPMRRKVLDFDDAIFHRYDEHHSPLVRFVLGRKIDSLMRHANMVTAGNIYLSTRATSAGCMRVEWLPTVVDLDRYPWPAVQRTAGEVVLGWIGSPATAGYLHVLTPALRKLQALHSFRCVAIGARIDQLAGTPFESWSWSESREVDLLRQIDVGVMPLPDAPWERGKCGYKLIQYMACGLPVVASPVGVNTRIVTPHENGYLASNTDEWVESLGRLVTDRELRERQGATGRRTVELTYSLQVQASRLVKMLREAGARS